MKFRIKFADQVVGAFILLAMIALAASLVLIGVKQRWFAKDYYFTSQFLSGSNIGPGTSLHLKGFVIGKIDRIKLNDANMVDVVFHIYDTYYPKVRKNSVLELSVSPIGLGSQLLFHPGLSQELIEEHSFIPRSDSELGQGLIEAGLVDIPVKDDTITRLLSNVNPLMENANKTIVNLNKTVVELNLAIKGQGQGPLADTLVNVRDATGSLNATLDNDVPAIMTEVRDTLARVNSISQRVDGITADVKDLTAAIKQPGGAVDTLIDPKGSVRTLLDDNNDLINRVNALLNEVKSTLANVDSMSRRLNNEMPNISILLNEGKNTLVKTQDVLEGLRNNPILKGGIPERKEQGTVFRSIRDEEF